MSDLTPTGKVFICTKDSGVSHFASAFTKGKRYELMLVGDTAVLEADNKVQYMFKESECELVRMDLSFEFAPEFERELGYPVEVVK